MKYLSKRPHTVNGGLYDIPTSVDDLFQRFWNVPATRSAMATVGWQPAIDIIETAQAYILKAELPGVAAESIDASVTGDTLVLRGEKMKEERLEGETLRVEGRTFGTFERTFSFPTPIAADSVDAQSKDGILTITIRKAEEAQPRRIEIRGS